MTLNRRPQLSRTFAAFRHPGFRTLWPANFFSMMSRWMQATLLGWMVLELTDSAWMVSLVGFFAIAPMLFVGLLSGVLADSFDRLRLIRTMQLVSLSVAICMAVVLLTGNEKFWHAYVVMALIGAAWALEMPTRRAMIHDLVGSRGVTNAVALDSIGMNAANMVGPALAGVLISQVNVAGGYVAVVSFYVVSAALVWTLRPVPREGVPPAGSPILADLLAGLKYAAGHRTLIAVVLITIVMNVLFFPYRFLIPVIARDVLGVGPGLMGLMDAITGFGATAGAIVIASISNVQRHGMIFLGGSIAAAAFLVLFSLSDVYATSMVVLLFLGISTAGFATMQATVVMLVSRAGMRGKALGVVSLAIGTSPLGSVIVGAMADRYGAPTAITISASVGLALLILLGLLMPSIRARTVLEEAAV